MTTVLANHSRGQSLHDKGNLLVYSSNSNSQEAAYYQHDFSLANEYSVGVRSSHGLYSFTKLRVSVCRSESQQTEKAGCTLDKLQVHHRVLAKSLIYQHQLVCSRLCTHFPILKRPGFVACPLIYLSYNPQY